MITGEHKDTALAIGAMLGLVDQKHSGAVMGTEIDNTDHEHIKEAVEQCNLFVRAPSQNKVSIVEAFHANGEVNGM